MMRHPTDGRVHFSELKAMKDSPAHFALACSKARELTRPMIVGAVADCMVFGQRGYARYPGKVRNGKEWEAWRDDRPGLIHCITSEEDDATGSADAVRADPVAASMLEVPDADFQVCAEWEAYGLECAAGIRGERGGFDLCGTTTDRMASLIDDIVPGRTFLADMKITSTAEPYAGSVHAWKMMWHAQLAWYVDGIEANGGHVDYTMLILAEAHEPHCVTVLTVSPNMLDDGRKSIAMWAERVRACDKAGTWPGYVQRAVAMVKPAWEEE